MSSGIAFPRSDWQVLFGVFFLFLSLCQICIFFNKLPCRLRFWWNAWSCLFLWHILVMIVCFLAHCKQFLGSWKVFCYMVDYAILFSEPDTYCRVSSSCGTTDEIKVSPFSPVFLFMLSTVEQRVFYFCFYSCLIFFIPVFKHSGISLKQDEHSQIQPLRKEREVSWSQVRPRLFYIWLAYYSTTSNITVISVTQKQKLKHFKSSISACPETALLVEKQKVVVKVYN